MRERKANLDFLFEPEDDPPAAKKPMAKVNKAKPIAAAPAPSKRTANTDLHRRQRSMYARLHPEPPPAPIPPAHPVKVEHIYSIQELHRLEPGKSVDLLRKIFRHMPGVEIRPFPKREFLDGRPDIRASNRLGVPESVYLAYRESLANP